MKIAAIITALSLIFIPISVQAAENFSENLRSKLKGEQTLVMFWRSDCAPCLEEMKILPDLAKKNASLTIALVSLQNAEATSANLPSLPHNVQVFIAQGDGKEVLAKFGDEKLALPFSLMLNADGSVCKKHYGIIGTDIVKDWQKQC